MSVAVCAFHDLVLHPQISGRPGRIALACEILGGVFGPPLAGVFNDNFGADSFLWMLMVLAVLSGFFSMFLNETAPNALARRGSLSVVSP